ncbi:MAG: dienelactone hydrolase family protein [Bacteroidota bacterium]
MIRKFIPSFIILCLSVSITAQNSMPGKTAAKYPYLIYLPEQYRSHPDSLYPLMIYLHGGSHRGTDLDLLKEWGPPKLISEGKQFDFIVVSPQCPGNKLWISENWFEPLMKDLISQYRIDTGFIGVTGISMGGFGAWNVAMDFHNRIKAIVPLCGSCADSVNICKIRHISIWAIHGVNDGLVKVINSDRLVNRLKECGADVKYSRLENRHHGIWNLYDTNEIYDWFKSVYISRKSSR